MATDRGLFRYLTRILTWLAWSGLILATLELTLTVYARGVGHLPGFFAPGLDGSYALAAGSQSHYWHLGRVVAVTIGSDGTRRVPSASDRPYLGTKPVTMHIVGDSQVFGWGLSDDETLSERIQQRLGPAFRVVNNGLPGQGPLGYFRTLAALPSQDPVVLLLTEMNDFQDAYSVSPSLGSHCGYLVRPDGIGPYVPCYLFRSQIAGLLLDLRGKFTTALTPLPLGFNPKATVAAHVLCRRIENGLRALSERRSGLLIVATIPWEGELVPKRRTEYAPQIAEAVAYTRLPGGMLLHQAFAAAPDPEVLFLPEDHHLSPEGADRVAEVLASLVQSGTSDHFPGCREVAPPR